MLRKCAPCDTKLASARAFDSLAVESDNKPLFGRNNGVVHWVVL